MRNVSEANPRPSSRLIHSINLAAGTALSPSAASASPAGRSALPGSKCSTHTQSTVGGVLCENSANSLDVLNATAYSIRPPTCRVLPSCRVGECVKQPDYVFILCVLHLLSRHGTIDSSHLRRRWTRDMELIRGTRGSSSCIWRCPDGDNRSTGKARRSGNRCSLDHLIGDPRRYLASDSVGSSG